MTKTTSFFGNIGRTFDAVGSLGSLAVDIVEGTIGLGSKTKQAIDLEVDSLREERNISNATSRILAKGNAIRTIMQELNCTAEEASSLLDAELKGKS